jgi:hypothetical protein
MVDCTGVLLVMLREFSPSERLPRLTAPDGACHALFAPLRRVLAGAEEGASAIV